jgi:hypothetical protein
LWLDGSDPIGTGNPPSGGSKLSTWKDKSGNGRDATATGIGPTYTTNSFNGLSAPVFDGTGMVTPSYLISTTSKLSVFIVCKKNGARAGNSEILALRSGWQYFDIFIETSGSQYLDLAYTNALTPFSTQATPNGTNLFISLVTNGSSIAGYLNGSSVFNTTSPNNGYSISVDNITSAWGISESAFVGPICEIIVYNTTFSTSQRQTVEGYLAHKWGLTKYYSPSFPLSISGCQLWLDAADSSTITGTTSITAWRDKSGKGNNAVFTGTNPSYVVASNAVITANLNQKFTVPAATLQQTTGSGSIFLVYGDQQTQGSSYAQLFSSLLPAQSFCQSLIRPDSYSYQFNNSTAPILATVVNALNTTNTLIYNMNYTYNSTTGSIRINGKTCASSFNSNTTPSGDLTISGSGWGDGANIRLYEVLTYKGSNALTTTECQQIEAYLARKWSVSVNESFLSTHPYANFIPSPLTEFIPKTITGCQLWLDGADPNGTAIVPANGATISIWKDKSGNTKNATVASGRVAGTYSSSLRAVNFATSSTGYGTTYPANPTNETMFVVFNNATPSSLNNILIGGQGGARSLGAGYTASGTGYVGNLNNGIVWLANTSPYTSGTTALVTSDFTSSTNSVSLNGGTAVSGGAPGFTSGTTTFIGVDTRDLGYYYVGYAMEIIFFNSVLTTEQRQQVEGYLALKWGLTGSLPSEHPYKSFSPFPVISVNFVPTLISGCQFWLDAADASTVTGTSAVTQWRDKSGNARNLGVGSGTTSYSSNAIVLNSSYMFVNSPVNLTNVTVFIVSKSTGVTNQILFSAKPNTDYVYNSVDGFGFYNDPPTGRIRFYGQGNDPMQSIFFTDTSITKLYTFQSTGTTVSGWLNGTSQSGGTLTTTRTSTAQGFAIGGEWGGSSYQNIIVTASIYEILVYNTALTTTQRQQVESYLAWKWGIQTSLPSDHTYKFAPPSV